MKKRNSLNEIKDKYIGKKDTVKRKLYEVKLKKEINKG
tara:strand:- start:391 stop:504 length:114 start_codon:yes stop_codon:yes gene_type:complete